MPLSSPRSPQARGFMPLDTSNMADNIPLTPVRTNASMGARKANQGISTGFETPGDNEKGGFFHGRRRAHPGPPGRSDTLASDEVSLNAMGRLYKKIVGFSVITRYLVYVVPIAIILAVPLVVVPMTDSNLTPVGKGGPPLIKFFIWIELAWLALWMGKIVAHLLPSVFMFLCGVVSSGTRKYATVIRALEIPLSLFFWALATWLVFKYLLGPFGVEWVQIVQKILGSLFVSSAVFLGEKTIVQLISITYHQRSFANRIRDSKRDIYLLGIMYDASRTLFPMYCDEFAEEDYIINDSIEMKFGGQKGHNRNASTTPMKLLGNVGRFGDKVTSVFGNLASEITGKQVFNPTSAHSVVVEALEKVRTSEALAKRVWMSFVVEGNDALYREDIVEVLGPVHEAEAEECFEAVDADGNGDISLDEMIRKVVEMSKERKAIANSMKDISQALAVFDKVLLFVVFLIVIFIFLAFFQSSFISTLATAGTALLSLSFAFSVTTQEFLGSCIFLFVKHPYDVGDRVDITGAEKEQLIVEKISLLYTVFNRIDKMQIVQVPNIILNNLWIENVSRSKAMKEVIDLNISYDTSFEDIELLRQEMENFVRHPDNARDFMADIIIGVSGVGDLDKLQLKVAIKHKSNWHNEAVRATRRSKFMCALTLALKRVPIYAPGGGGEALGAPGNPAYNVAVSDSWASAAREKADTAKEEKRMASTKKPERNPTVASKKGGQAEASEVEAAQQLNTRIAALAVEDDWGFNRDDDTLNSRGVSRDQSLNRQAREADAAREEMLQRNKSGRRKAGEGLPATAISDRPGISVTQYNTRSAYDEEAQMGENPYASESQTRLSYPQQPAETAYPVASLGAGTGSAGVAQAVTYPAQAPAPLAPRRAPSTPSGSRQRGASVSNNNPHAQR